MSVEADLKKVWRLHPTDRWRSPNWILNIVAGTVGRHAPPDGDRDDLRSGPDYDDRRRNLGNFGGTHFKALKARCNWTTSSSRRPQAYEVAP